MNIKFDYSIYILIASVNRLFEQAIKPLGYNVLGTTLTRLENIGSSARALKMLGCWSEMMYFKRKFKGMPFICNFKQFVFNFCI